MHFLNDAIDQAWKGICKPQKIKYTLQDLGKKVISLNNYTANRQDFQIRSNENHRINACFYEIDNCDKAVIYLHSVGGNLVEGSVHKNQLISNNIQLCLFDFNGCGKSEGEYLTYGSQEIILIKQIINTLKIKYRVKQIAIWGRSMGAYLAVKYASQNTRLTCGVYDSPFNNLETLIFDKAQQISGLPSFVVQIFVNQVKQKIQENANFNVSKVDSTEFCQNCRIPGIFLYSDNDELINKSHIETILKNYKGENCLIKIKEGHTKLRDKKDIEQVIKFLIKNFETEEIQRMKSKSIDIGIRNNFQYINSENNQNRVYSQFKGINLLKSVKLRQNSPLKNQTSPLKKKKTITQVNIKPVNFNVSQQVTQYCIRTANKNNFNI